MNRARIRQRWKQAVAGREAAIRQAVTRLRDLIGLMADLRGPTGCPWDREQSLASLRQFVTEEAGEVCAAIDAILALEEQLRADAGMPPSSPRAPDGVDRARSATKGQSIAHHPHRADFKPQQSASGAPLPALSPAQVKALDTAYAALCSELGDLLLQNIFMGDILHAMGRPGVEGSLAAIIAKLVRRHPHVYGEFEAQDSAAVLHNWERIKQAERRGEP